MATVSMRTGRAISSSLSPSHAPHMRCSPGAGGGGGAAYTVTRSHAPTRLEGDDIPLTRGDVAWVELHSDGGGWAFGSSGGQTGLIAAWCVSPAASPSRVAGGDRAPPPIAAHARGEEEVEFVFAMGGGSKAEDGAHGPVRGTTPPHLRANIR